MDTRWPSFPKTYKRRNPTALLGSLLAMNFWSWLPQVIIVSTILAAASAFLWPSPIEFPMDDSYIHLVYAKNLSEHGGLLL